MVFNDTTTKTGLVQDCEMRIFGGDFGAISSNTKRLQVFTNLLNRALDKVTYRLLSSSNTWQWDDYNRTDFPEATTDLVLGQGDYSLDVSHLIIREVQIKDESGQWYKLLPIDERDLELTNNSISIEQRFSENGAPQYFDMIGGSVILYPAPSYAQSASLKIKSQRGHEYFVTSDTSKTPGFASIFHGVVSALACAEWAVINNHDNAKNLVELSDRAMESLSDFQLNRQKNRNNRTIPKYKRLR